MSNSISIRYAFAAVAFVLFSVFSCTPKVADQAQSDERPKEDTVEVDLRCATFDQSPIGEASLDAHVIYRDYIKMEEYELAFPYWHRAYSTAPAADGKRETHFEDGIDIYENRISKTDDPDLKRSYLDTIFDLYDHMGECYHAGDVGYIAGRKAFDLYYKHRDFIPNDTVYGYFTKSLDADGLKAHSFVVNPFTALLVEMYQNDELSKEEASEYASLILDICEGHEDDPEEGWPIVLGYAPVRLEYFETIRGFFPCEHFVEKYYDPVNLDSADCEEIFFIGTRLRTGGCSMESEELRAISAAYGRNCRISTPDTLLAKARDLLEEGNYQQAVDAYERYLEDKDDPEKLAKYNLRIAKIYYGHIKNFSKSRQFAYKALEHRPNWGEPYMLIGKLYASSGPLCGPGRGWDSQIVTWPAIDKFRKAKSVDPSVAGEANKLISRYSQYMPSVEDVFQRQIKEGESFYVGCWIQENTVVRTAP